MKKAVSATTWDDRPIKEDINIPLYGGDPPSQDFIDAIKNYVVTVGA